MITTALCAAVFPAFTDAQSGVREESHVQAERDSEMGANTAAASAQSGDVHSVTPHELQRAIERLAQEYNLEGLEIHCEPLGDKVSLTIAHEGVTERYILAAATFFEWADAEFSKRQNGPRLMGWNGQLRRVRRRARRDVLSWNSPSLLGAEGLDSPRN